MDRKNMESTLNEVRILCSIESEYVVGYNDAFLSKKGSELCIGKLIYFISELFKKEGLNIFRTIQNQIYLVEHGKKD